MTPAVATVAARIAARTWGGRWTAEKPLETRKPGSFPGSTDLREENDEQRTA
jgi:hypothetical protein